MTSPTSKPTPGSTLENAQPLGPRKGRSSGGANNGNSGTSSPPRSGRKGAASGGRPPYIRLLGTALRRNSFVLLLAVGFLLFNALLSSWDPMSTSRRFYKDDFTKTLYHHQWDQSGPVFFGNSAVTGAYIEDQAQVPLVEMGLSYGKLTDLKQILRQHHYTVEDQLVVGIDAHTMLDALTTDPTYRWFKKWYQPYAYFYRDYFKDSGQEWLTNAWKGLERGVLDFHTYEPRWIDKELYFGRNTPDQLKADWTRYQQMFNWMTLDDMQDNLDALDWVIAYAGREQLPLKIVLMPLNPDPAYPQPGYWKPLKAHVAQAAKAADVPLLDVSDAYSADKFHDLVHLNREVGAPQFTREVDAWLRSFASSSK